MGVPTITNPLHVAAECIFCLDNGGVKNEDCECKYFYHPKCKAEWEQHNDSCVMCRKVKERTTVYIIVPVMEEINNDINNCRRKVLMILFIIAVVGFTLIMYRLFF